MKDVFGELPAGCHLTPWLLVDSHGLTGGAANFKSKGLLEISPRTIKSRLLQFQIQMPYGHNYINSTQHKNICHLIIVII